MDAQIQGLPRVVVLEQRVKAMEGMSLCEINMQKLHAALHETRKGDLLIVDEPCAGMAKEDQMIVLSLLRDMSLTIKGITKHHLHQYNFHLPLSCLVGVTGRVGAGKTTLLSTVYGALGKDKYAWKLRSGQLEMVLRLFYVFSRKPISKNLIG